MYTYIKVQEMVTWISRGKSELL